MGRNRRNQELLSQVLVKAGYAVKVVLTPEALIPTVDQGPVALVLLDITGFDAKIWQSCQALRSRAIPFFVISPPKALTYLPSMSLTARYSSNRWPFAAYSR